MNVIETKSPIHEIECDAVIVAVFEEEPLPPHILDLDKRLNNLIANLARIGSSEISGKSGTMSVLHTNSLIASPRVVVIGLGSRAKFKLNSLRIILGKTIRLLRDADLKSISIAVHFTLSEPDQSEAVSIVTETAQTSMWEPDTYKLQADRKSQIETFTVANQGNPEIGAAIETGKIVGESMNLTRTLVNEPANALPPAAMAERAKLMAADVGLGCEILDEDIMYRHNMGGILSVSVGSENRARLIVLKHTPLEGEPTLALIGKGITFDTGGISIKPTEGMGAMKGDMAGAAAVIGAMRAIALLKLPINVVGVAPCAENMPSGKAFRPGDVIRFMNGKTSEIITTDAEGRLVLADAITYCIRNLRAKHLVDVATLTGACVVALGHISTGAWTNDESFLKTLKTASDTAGEYVWHMPLFEEYRQPIKSDIADMKNSGGRPGGAISAAMFLEEFVEETPWIHLDIAGTATTDNAAHIAKGPTAAMVRTFIELSRQMAS